MNHHRWIFLVNGVHHPLESFLRCGGPRRSNECFAPEAVWVHGIHTRCKAKDGNFGAWWSHVCVL
jgi:hypothetical protein